MTTHVAIRRSALAHNVRQVLANLDERSRLLAVVKANAYGHGLVPVAQTCLAAGAAWLGVSSVADGIALREAGVSAPILVFLPPLEDEYEGLVEHDLTATIIAAAQVRMFSEASKKVGQPVKAHLYVDTGLGRIGSDDSLPDLLENASAFPNVQVTGVYTHFGPPGSGRMLEELDFLRDGASIKGFAGLARDAVAQFGGQKPLIHAAASALFLEDRAWHLDLVRVGNLLYGQYPDHVKHRNLDLREDTFELRSRIIAVQTLPKGSKVGYGGTFICARETKVATVPVGLTQGLGMAPLSIAGRWQSAAKAWLNSREGVRGQSTHALRATIGLRQAPLIGRISMDQCCLDVTDVPEATIGALVALPVRRLAVDGTVPRVYLD